MHSRRRRNVVSNSNRRLTVQPLEDRLLLDATISLERSYATHVESIPNLVMSVARTGDTVAASVAVRTLELDANFFPNRALAGEDYQSIDISLTWQAGETATKSVTIPILNDAATEGAEAFAIELHSANGFADLGEIASTEIVLFDDENILGAAANITKVPGDGFNSVQFTPNGRFSQILWIGEHLIYRLRQPNGVYAHEVITGDLADEGDDFRDDEQAQLLYFSDGTAHVLAISQHQMLSHYERRGDRWLLTETVAIPIDYGLFSFSFTAAIGADNALHILLHQATDDGDPPGVLTYATNRSGSWVFETATTTPQQPRRFFGLASEPRYFSLAVDSQGFAHVAYTPSFENFPSTGGTVRPISRLAYLTNRSGVWTSQIVFEPSDGSGDAGLGASIAIGPGDSVAIAHFYVERVDTGSAQFSRLQYFTRTVSGTFNLEIVATQPDGYVAGDGPQFTGFAPHLRFDHLGRPNIAFSDYASQHFAGSGADEFGGQIRHAVKIGNQWRIQTVYQQRDPVSNQVIYPSMALSTTEMYFASLVRLDEVAPDGRILSIQRLPLLVSAPVFVQGPGRVRFNPTTSVVREGAGSATFTVVRSDGVDGAVSVNWSITGGSALAGADYLSASGILNWATGESGPKTFTIQVLDDALVETDETLQVSLSSPAGGVFLDPTSAAASLILESDDSPAGNLQFAIPRFIGREGRSGVFAVARTGGAVGAVSVAYTAIGQSALAGVDFSATVGRLHWTNGELGTKFFSMPFTDDGLREGLEHLLVQLSDPQGGALLGPVATAPVALIDNEFTPTVRSHLSLFFDEELYLDRNPDVLFAVADAVFSSGFEHFAKHGQFENRIPNELFREATYLAMNPDVAQAVVRGSLTSGYEHYVLSGHREGRLFNALFDESIYLSLNPDVAQVVRAGQLPSAYVHFFHHGQAENRRFSQYFSEEFYLQNNPDVAQAVQAGQISSGLAHFFESGQFEGRTFSRLFDEHVYRAMYPDVMHAIGSGALRSGFEHYLLAGRFEGRITTALFDEGLYLSLYPDVAAAVAAGAFSSGRAHFVAHGRLEQRRYSRHFDEQFYLSSYPDVAAAVTGRFFRSGYDHFVRHGQFEGRKGIASS